MVAYNQSPRVDLPHYVDKGLRFISLNLGILGEKSYPKRSNQIDPSVTYSLFDRRSEEKPFPKGATGCNQYCK